MIQLRTSRQYLSIYMYSVLRCTGRWTQTQKPICMHWSLIGKQTDKQKFLLIVYRSMVWLASSLCGSGAFMYLVGLGVQMPCAQKKKAPARAATCNPMYNRYTLHAQPLETMQLSTDTTNPILSPALKVGAVTGPSFHSLGGIKHRSRAYFFYAAEQEWRVCWWVVQMPSYEDPRIWVCSRCSRGLIVLFSALRTGVCWVLAQKVPETGPDWIPDYSFSSNHTPSPAQR